MTFKVGDRVKHLELIFRHSGTVTGILSYDEHLGHLYQVRWDSPKKTEYSYGVYLRSLGESYGS